MLKGLLLKGNQLCIPRSSVRESLIKEFHEGGLVGPVGIEKILALTCEYFYWPRMARDVEFIVRRCIICQKAKGRLLPHGLYLPLSVPQAP